MPARSPDQGRGTVPVVLVAEILQAVSEVIHDGPVQQIVAAQLMLETAHTGQPTALVQRGMTAVSTAGTQSRQVMWALARPEVRLDHLADDLALSLALGHPGAEAPRVTATLDGTEDEAQVGALLDALHDTAVDAIFAGHALIGVAVVADAEGLEATVTSEGVGRAPGPWVEFARHRLDAVGGEVVVQHEDDHRVVVIRVS